MKNIFKIILTILVFTLFFALLPSLPAAAGQYAEAASRAMAQPETTAPFIGSAPAWVQILIASVCGLMMLVALTPLIGQTDPNGETSGVVRP